MWSCTCSRHKNFVEKGTWRRNWGSVKGVQISKTVFSRSKVCMVKESIYLYKRPRHWHSELFAVVQLVLAAAFNISPSAYLSVLYLFPSTFLISQVHIKKEDEINKINWFSGRNMHFFDNLIITLLVFPPEVLVNRYSCFGRSGWIKGKQIMLCEWWGSLFNY